MRVRLRLDGRKPRRWHALLLDGIAASGIAVEVDGRPGPPAWPANADLLFRLEALIHRLPQTASAPVPDLSGWPEAGGAIPDLILDACGDVDADEGARVWRLTCEGLPLEAGLLASLIAGRAPVVALQQGERLIASGRVGTERRDVVSTAFDDALMRTVSLVAAALIDRGDGRVSVGVEGAVHAAPPNVEVAGRLLRMLARGLVQRLYHLCYHAPHWRVGWRYLAGPDLIDIRRHPEPGWRNLPDDGRRFYADPFPLDHQGETWVFVEEFVHALGKGLISAVRFSTEGPAGTPEPVLEEPHHLSYPFVFVRDGAAWMVPESGAAGTIDLYRAASFPGGWEKVATLVSGVVASDATLIEQSGTWWMFATVRGASHDAPLGSGSYSDALHLWSAPDFRGPWAAHPRNPVLIDIASARPAGRIVARDGRLIRPVQDCTGGYGRALALARIDRLDADGYAQTVETVLSAGPGWPGTRLHTLNRSAALECIDGSARSPRIRTALRR